MNELRIRGGTVVTPQGARRADVLVRDGCIVRVGRVPSGGRSWSARGLVVFPGVIDAHAHLSLPVAGTRSADDFLSGTRAAAAGGVTTVIDFTLGAPEITLPEAIERRIAEAAPAIVDYALRGEMIGWTADRTAEIDAAARLGVRAFKFYLSYAESGRRTSLDTLRAAMHAIRSLRGVAMVHAEAQELTDPAGGPTPTARPAVAEAAAVAEVGALAADTGCMAYIAHISSAQGLAALEAAQLGGAPIVGETCPQYLLLTDEVYGRDDGHLFTVVPPLRGHADRRALWRALGAMALQAVATDHCPFTREQKEAGRTDLSKAPSGLPGLELLPALVLSEGWAKGRLSLRKAAWYLAEGPARAFGLFPRKGAIVPGADADLLLWDPHIERTVTADALHMATDFSPYEGHVLSGAPVGVLSRGDWIMRDGELLAIQGRGRFLPWGKAKR